MPIQKRMCVNHPNRPAIGICIITKKAICAECSTRYEGVNYSKEGLAILQKERAKKKNKGSALTGLSTLIGWVMAPLFTISLYFFYLYICNMVIDIVFRNIWN